jgi:Domain of unknown function (DUF222)
VSETMCPNDVRSVSESTSGVLERLGGTVDRVVAIEPAELSDVALAGGLVALRREMDRLEAVFARLAHAGHVRGVGSVDGAVSTAAWLRHRAGMREGDAKAAIECGAMGELLADTGAAWRSGEISSGAARTIAAARVEGNDDRFSDCEGVFIELARAGDMRNLRRATAHFRNLARADGREPRVPDGLHLSRTFENRTMLSCDLGGVAAETVATAVHAYTDPPSDDDPQPISQRNAAALVRICEVAIAHLGDVERPKAAVTFVIDWPTLTDGELGRCDGAFTGPINPEEIRELLCDCSVSRVVTGPKGEPLDVGRSRRTPPPPMHRALDVRDEGCRFPGCNRPPGWCDAHHVVHWTKGGHTKLDNLVLLCDRHHHVVHQPGWSVELDGDDFRARRPDGTEVT